MPLRILLPMLATMLVVAAPVAHAAHPLQSEDTGTQGTGNVEIENGIQRARSGPTAIFTYQPQVSLGLATTFDAILQPSFLSIDSSGQAPSHVSGFGDTNADFKWRFFGVDPWSLAIRAGLELPTAQDGLGLPHDEIAEHARLVATWDATPTTVHANIGVTHVPPLPGTRATTVGVSAAVMHALDARLVLTADAGLAQPIDASRHGWSGTILVGAIWTLRPGLDVDVGWQSAFHDVATTHTWLAGLTWRFAL